VSDWPELRRREAATRRAEVIRLPVLATRFRAALAAGNGGYGPHRDRLVPAHHARHPRACQIVT